MGISHSLDDWSCDLGYMTLRGYSRQTPEPSMTVLALHGYLDNANSVSHLSDAFDDANFICIDLAGHGHSDHRPAGVHYNQLDYVQDILAVINVMRLKKVVILGHSLGGILASVIAAVVPDKVHAVISIDAFGPLTEPADSTVSQLSAALVSRRDKCMPVTEQPADINSAAEARARLTDLSKPLCKTILERNIKTGQGKTVWRSDPRLRTKSLLRLTEEQASHIMQAISCPFFVIGASVSFKNMAEVFNERLRWIPQATLSIVEGGHHVHMEQPDIVIQQIRQFVSNM